MAADVTTIPPTQANHRTGPILCVDDSHRQYFVDTSLQPIVYIHIKENQSVYRGVLRKEINETLNNKQDCYFVYTARHESLNQAKGVHVTFEENNTNIPCTKINEVGRRTFKLELDNTNCETINDFLSLHGDAISSNIHIDVICDSTSNTKTGCKRKLRDRMKENDSCVVMKNYVCLQQTIQVSYVEGFLKQEFILDRMDSDRLKEESKNVDKGVISEQDKQQIQGKPATEQNECIIRKVVAAGKDSVKEYINCLEELKVGREVMKQPDGRIIESVSEPIGGLHEAMGVAFSDGVKVYVFTPRHLFGLEAVKEEKPVYFKIKYENGDIKFAERGQLIVRCRELDACIHHVTGVSVQRIGRGPMVVDVTSDTDDVIQGKAVLLISKFMWSGDGERYEFHGHTAVPVPQGHTVVALPSPTEDMEVTFRDKTTVKCQSVEKCRSCECLKFQLDPTSLPEHLKLQLLNTQSWKVGSSDVKRKHKKDSRERLDLAKGNTTSDSEVVFDEVISRFDSFNLLDQTSNIHKRMLIDHPQPTSRDAHALVGYPHEKSIKGDIVQKDARTLSTTITTMAARGKIQEYKKIQSYYVFLTEELKNGIDDVICSLFSKGVIDDNDKNILLHKGTDGDNTPKVRAFLDILMYSGEGAYAAFVQTLRQHGFIQAVAKLEQDYQTHPRRSTASTNRYLSTDFPQRDHQIPRMSDMKMTSGLDQIHPILARTLSTTITTMATRGKITEYEKIQSNYDFLTEELKNGIDDVICSLFSKEVIDDNDKSILSHKGTDGDTRPKVKALLDILMYSGEGAYDAFIQTLKKLRFPHVVAKLEKEDLR